MPNPLALGRASRNALALAVLSLLAAAATLPGVARADIATACATSAMSASNQPACWRPFTASSPFNTELPADPALASDNAAVQQHMATYGWSLNGSNTSFTLSGDGTRPVYFARPSDPVLTVHCTNEDGPGTCRGWNYVDVSGAQINVPAGASPDGNWDGHMTVIETATDTEYDFWHVSISGSTLTAGSGSETNLATSDGTGSQGDAAYFAATAGLLRPSELASGQIDHALVITAPCTNATGANVGYAYPALAGWGEFCGDYWNETAATAPMLGQRFQLDMTEAQIAGSGAPAWEQTIMTALARYGAYIEDTNGSWHDESMDILTQDPASWTSVGQANEWASVISQLGGRNSILTSAIPIPVSKLELVNTCVTQGTCPGANGIAPRSPSPTPPTTTTTPTPRPVTTTNTTTTTRTPTQTTTTRTPTRTSPPASSGSTQTVPTRGSTPSSSTGSHPARHKATRKRSGSARHASRSVPRLRRTSQRMAKDRRRSRQVSRHARRPHRRVNARRAHSRD